LPLLPADIAIIQDEHGRPTASGAWTQRVRTIPEISLSHSEGLTVALVGDGAAGRRFGVDVQAVRELQADFETIAFLPEEQRLLEGTPEPMRSEWLLRLWCAKEAVAKALGRGLIEGPRSVRILSLNVQTGVVGAMAQGKLAEAVPEAAGRQLQTYTARERSWVVATAIFEKRSS
jgi:phosphopantetheinyl transferase